MTIRQKNMKGALAPFISKLTRKQLKTILKTQFNFLA